MDENYTIDSKIMQIDISSDEIDRILDLHLDQEEVKEDESELIVMYVLQLFYRSGRRETCTQEVFEKYNNLIAGRVITLMDGMGIIEESYDVEKKDYVYQLTEEGRKLADDIL